MVSRMKDRVAVNLSKWTSRIDEKLQKWLQAKSKCRTPVGRNKLRTQSKYKHTRLRASSTILAMQNIGGKPCERTTRFDSDAKQIGVDNRCSACISPYIEDFIGPLETCERVIKGFHGAKVMSVKRGTLKWKWEDDNGAVHVHKIPDSYYIPGSSSRLLSPQHWAKYVRKGSKYAAGCETYADRTILFWDDRKFKRTILHSKADKCATFHLAGGFQQYNAYRAEVAEVWEREMSQNPVLCEEVNIASSTPMEENDVINNSFKERNSKYKLAEIISDTSDELSPSVTSIHTISNPEPSGTSIEAQLLQYHHKFGHISFERLKQMAKIGILPKSLMNARTPACTACLYAKATKRPWRNKSRNEYKKDQVLRPGQRVHVDQLVSPTPGFIAQLTGKLTLQRYRYATVFVDAYSGYSYVHLQKTATVEETIEAKKAFEALASQSAIIIHHYHADNGVFRANGWIAECRKNNQLCTFTPVGAHHDNGIAEKRIRDLQDLSRAMMTHAASRWPKAITANLWPYALRVANEVINDTPSPTREMSYSQTFHNTSVNINPKHYLPFGCPAYTLDSDLQAGKPFHKWKERTIPGIYLGKSPVHSKNVSLILNLQTGLVSPQFHIKADPMFDTVKDIQVEPTWYLRAGFVPQREKAQQPNMEMKGETAPSDQTLKRTAYVERSTESNNIQGNKKPRVTPALDKEAEPRVTSAAANGIPEHTSDLATKANSEKDNKEISAEQNEEEVQPHRKSPMMEPRDRNLEVDMSTDSQMKTIVTEQRLITALTTEIESQKHPTGDGQVEGELMCLESIFPNYEMDRLGSLPINAYKATIDPDTMYLHEAMRQKDWTEFRRAMQKEIDDRIEGENFEVVERSMVPEGVRVLPAVWQLKRKRDIRTGAIKKYKARLNIDGSRMERGVHYDESYAPVASWNSIRLLLAMAATHGWHTMQLDFVAAFPQAPVERELYMEVPRGVLIEGVKNTKDYVLRLKKNLYGQKQAGRVWNQYLIKKLKQIGFKQSEVDECLFYKGKTMYVLYTDDSLLAGPDRKEIDMIINDMKRIGLDITVEGDIQDFLGVNIERKDDGSVQLTQPQLIESILKDLNLADEKVIAKTTPAATSKILKRHMNSPKFQNDFNYRSIIGRLNYLERGTRSDISYITHQCARYSVDPRKEHGDAVRWLGRYLKGTKDKGTIFKPDPHKGLEVYVDADFAGNFDKDDCSRDTARSRHGYYIFLHGCPIVWKSQLQTEIALSSTESEYTGLSYALREAIPIIETLKELEKAGFPVRADTPKIKCKVYEDNSGALEIASNHKYRPRTKHINNKLHHFRDYVSRGEISIVRIGTKDQLADILTKPVTEDILKTLRKRAMGW